MTVSKAVEKVMEKQPFLLMALEKGLINYSACANYLKNDVEKIFKKKVSTESILMSLRRINFKYSVDIEKKLKNAVSKTSYIVYSGVYDLVIDYNYQDIKRILSLHIEKKIEDSLLALIIGSKYASIIINEKELFERIKNIKELKIIKSIENLTVFTIKIKEQDIETPGIIDIFSREFTKRNISIVEFQSTYTEISFIIDEKDVNDAISAYNSLKKRFL